MAESEPEGPANRSSRPTGGWPAGVSGFSASVYDAGAGSGDAAKARQSRETPVVSLAGYTNAGKSTLLNALTGADVSVNDRLFETLDPTTRGFEHEGRRYLITDTVGFIRRLPHQLVQGFAATLEETLFSDLILHVADASRTDESLEELVEAVDSVLREIGASELPVEFVLNKIDRVDPLRRRRLANRFPGSIQVSAATGEGLTSSKRALRSGSDRFERVRMLIPHGEGNVLAELYGLGAPIEERARSPMACWWWHGFPRRAVSVCALSGCGGRPAGNAA